MLFQLNKLAHHSTDLLVDSTQVLFSFYLIFRSRVIFWQSGICFDGLQFPANPQCDAMGAINVWKDLLDIANHNYEFFVSPEPWCCACQSADSETLMCVTQLWTNSCIWQILLVTNCPDYVTLGTRILPSSSKNPTKTGCKLFTAFPS